MQRGTLLRPRPVRRGKGKTGVGDTVEGKGVSQEGGEGRRMPSRRYKMEVAYSSETSVSALKSMCWHKPEDHDLQNT
jgi:hypothetical protein